MGRLARPGLSELHPGGKGFEYRPVTRKRDLDGSLIALSFTVATQRQSRVGVTAGQSHDRTSRGGVPPRKRRFGTVEQRRDCTRRSDDVSSCGPEERRPRFVTLLAVSIQPLEPVDIESGVAPFQRGLW